MTYSVIYADPPWKYNARNNPNTKFGSGTPYPTMPTEAIEALPVESIANDNAALFLWVTGPYAAKGHHTRVMEAWDFRPVTIAFTWVKTNNNGSYRFGPGYYTGSNAELCFLGIRGKMKPANNAVRQVIARPIDKHSKKPAETRARIEALFGDVPRVELFARQRATGWDTWGNELRNDIEL